MENDCKNIVSPILDKSEQICECIFQCIRCCACNCFASERYPSGPYLLQEDIQKIQSVIDNYMEADSDNEEETYTEFSNLVEGNKNDCFVHKIVKRSYRSKGIIAIETAKKGVFSIIPQNDNDVVKTIDSEYKSVSYENYYYKYYLNENPVNDENDEALFEKDFFDEEWINIQICMTAEPSESFKSMVGL